ncbi:MAG: putative toxin-antitoxin system toxin component, PIN family, partial [bacterium]
MESVAVVMDTNVLVSALLWNGIPHEILKLVKVGKVKLFVTIEILNEIEEVLNRDKFTNRILDLRTSVEELMLGLINLVEIVKINRKIKLKPKEIPSDVDDIIFLL